MCTDGGVSHRTLACGYVMCGRVCKGKGVCAEGIRMRETVDFRVMLRGVLSCGLTVRVCSSV